MKKQLIWIYPPNKWISNFNKTFVYGFSNPRARLYVLVRALRRSALTKIKIFPNGNFAQAVKLPKKENKIQLVQILNGRKKIVTRNIIVKNKPVGADQCVRPSSVDQCVCPKSVLASPCIQPMVIVIDPGHGGKEHGTHSPKGIPEKHFNLILAKMLYKKLQKNVYLTRTSDQFVSLKQRVNFAKKKKCNILISIHHNALPDNEDPLKHKGIGIYYTHDFVKPFATKILNSIVETCHGMSLQKYGIFKRNFALTRPDFCYAVLIECGFLIHPVESEIVTKKIVQKKIVKGIVRALRATPSVRAIHELPLPERHFNAK